MSEPARWTQEEYEAHMRGFGLTPSNDPPSPASKRTQPKRGVMNKTETLYAAVLEAKKTAPKENDRAGTGEIQQVRFEGVTLTLAPGCRFTPDFMVTRFVDWEGFVIEFHEVKAGRKRKSGNIGPHMEDDARVKLLTAAKLFPEFEFYLAWLWKDKWEVERIGE